MKPGLTTLTSEWNSRVSGPVVELSGPNVTTLPVAPEITFCKRLLSSVPTPL